VGRSARAGSIPVRRTNGVIMPKPGDKIHIPISERDALAGLLAVKPTAEMPRPGANPTGKKKPKKKAAKR
jgi:hypothetical protein